MDSEEKVVQLMADRSRPARSVEIRLEGDGVAIVGGGNRVNQPRKRAKLDPDSPNVIHCPQCTELAWRYTPECDHCGYPVVQHYERRARDRRILYYREASRHRTRVAVALMAVGAVVLVGTVLAGVGGWGFVGLGVMMAGAIAGQRAALPYRDDYSLE